MSVHSWHPRHLWHLAGRAWGAVRARPLSPREESEVAGLLADTLAELFWAQPIMDQRHGLNTARHALALAPGRRDLAGAALMHDCGKRHARLGVLGRACATMTALLRLPRPKRWKEYLDHSEIGAADLVAIGAPEVTVSFARHHGGERPDGFDPDDWEVLHTADGESHRSLEQNQYDGPRQ